MEEGTRIGHFELLEQLPGGKMGVVWLARDTVLSRKVVLKFLKPELTSDPNAVELFINEAKAASSLDHPNICTIYEVDQAEVEGFYIAMAHYQGRTLREWIDERPLRLTKTLEIASQIARGLEVAHHHSIVHRDIKPENIIITEDGVAKILDFGLALLKDGSAPGVRPGETAGTVAYMSPEQARGEEVDQRTDIWSLGVVVYEMLTGVRPFRGEYPAAVVYSITSEDPEPVSAALGKKFKKLDTPVLKALSKAPEHRYQQAQDFLNDLCGSVPKPVFLRAVRLTVAALVLIAVVFGLNWVGNFGGGGNDPDQRRVAILAFTNGCTGDAGQQPFVEGLPNMLEEELLALSRKVQTFRIVPTSYLALNDARDAGRELGVNLVILGKLICDGPSGAIDLSLVDARNNSLVEKGRVEGELEDRNELILRTKRKVHEMLRLRVEEPASGTLAASPDLQGTYLEGRGYLLQFDEPEAIRKAIDRFQAVVEAAPDFAAAHAGLAQAYRHMYRHEPEPGWIEKSRAEAERAVSLDNMNPESYIGKGLMLLEFGEWEAALDAFDRALNLDSDNVRALRGEAMAFAAGNLPGDAVDTYKYAIRIQPDDWAGYHELGKFHLARGDYQAAVENFERARELIPESTNAANTLAVAFIHMNRCDMAEPLLQASLQIKNNGHAHDLLATCYYKTRRYEEALEQYLKALELDKSNWTLRSNLATTYRRLGRDQEADRHYAEALRLIEEQLVIDPANPEHLLDYADYLCELREFGRSLEQLQFVAGMTKLQEDPWLLCLTGQVYEKLGKREEAIEWVLKALKKGWPRDAIEESPTLARLVKDPEWMKRSALVGGN